MRFFSEQYLVIDYGSTSIKGVLYLATPTETRVVRVATMELPESEEKEEEANKIDTADDAGERAAEQAWDGYAPNIESFVRLHFPDQSSYLIHAPMDRIFIRDLSVPVSDPAQILQVLPYEVESLLPISLDESVVVGHLVKSDKESSHLISFSMEGKQLTERVEPLLTETTYVRLCVPESAGLASLIRLLDAPRWSETTIGQIDMGGRYTVINLVHDGRLHFTRHIPLGGETITDLIVDTTGASRAQAYGWKCAMGSHILEDSSPALSDAGAPSGMERKHFRKIVQGIRAIYGELAEEIHRTLLVAGLSPVQYYLSGGASLFAGTESFLQTALDSQVLRYPFLINEGESFAPWATAVGISEHYGLRRRERVDFLSTPLGRSLRRGELRFQDVALPSYLASAALVLLLLGFIVGMLRDRHSVSLYDAKILQVARGIPGLRTSGDVVAEAVAMCRQRLQSSQYSGDSGGFLDLMKEVSDRTPAAGSMNFRLQNFEYNGRDVDMEAEVDRLSDATAVERAYKESHLFSKVDVQSDLKADQKVRLRIKLSIAAQRMTGGADCN